MGDVLVPWTINLPVFKFYSYSFHLTDMKLVDARPFQVKISLSKYLR